MTATAVAAALSAANVDEATAADQIDAARQTISDNVDQALAAINQNPAPGEAPADTGGAVTGDAGAGTGAAGTGGADAGTGDGTATGDQPVE